MIVIVLGKADWNTSFKCIVSAIISQNYNSTRNYVILVLAMSSVQETGPTLHLKISSRNCTVLTFIAKKVKLSWSICITSDGLDTARNQLHGATEDCVGILHVCYYSGTPRSWTLLGQTFLSFIARCPQIRGCAFSINNNIYKCMYYTRQYYILCFYSLTCT